MKHAIISFTMYAFTVILLSSIGSAQEKDYGITWVHVEGGEDGDYYLSSTEITFDQYDLFCTATEREKPKAEFGRGKQPVINVSYDDALEYCEWLGNELNMTIRLPKATEWIFAARGGTKSRQYLYSGSNRGEEVAWFIDNANGSTHVVGTKKPNELGLYDMSGNVWEWCDTYSIRSGGNWGYGGSWDMHDLHCRIPTKIVFDGDYKLSNLGFRVLREP